MLPNYDTIVLSGGGIKGIGLLGGLQYLADNNRLHPIRKFIGTSIGAIIGYLICIGYTPIEIMIFINTEKIVERMFKDMDIMNMIHYGGLINYTVLNEILERLTILKIGHLITLLQLYNQYNKELICCTYNHSHKKCEYISYKNNPDMPCITALRLSSNLPFLFLPFYYNHNYYIDGAIYNNFPISEVSDDDIAIGLQLCNSMSKDIHTKNSGFNLLYYILDILYIPIYHVQQFTRDINKNIDIIRITVSLPIFKWNINMTERFDNFSNGYEMTKQYFQKLYIVPIQ